MTTSFTTEQLTSQLSRRGAVLRLSARLLATGERTAPLVLRAMLGLVMFPHGAQKALGWFGGYGFSGTMGYLTGTIGLPSPLAALVILLEFLGPLLLFVGILVRPVAAGFVAIMLGAIFTTHLPHGFFMNWFGNQQGEGFEYHLLVIAIAAALVVEGGGRFALDRRFAARTA